MMEWIAQAHQWLDLATRGLLVLMMAPLGMTLVRLLYGPSVADRFVALDMLTGVAAATAALVMSTTGRREFLDVGLGLAVFGFVGTCALAAFLERQARGSHP
ncbi:cation transporter [Corticibacter populi]|uniref:Cation transporter n=1 Tax=Corticibacter populi TaxID=1550736 RepID=A0A3M6QZ67_9BURK|nr:monovalent cation/H+ antiporter complex subunit F [Corticibacter populi]RMX08203.1 cation transporter [Corticibacter populi]RZS35468.1 multisubunit sodium/proton antiporter MrpF subunit [Corticibacter populi]